MKNILFQKTPVLLLIAFTLSALISCSDKSPKENAIVGNADPIAQRDLKEIMKSKKLIVLAENSATSYFIYKGQKMGLEYEILKEFAKDLGVKLEIRIVNNLDKINDKLNSGEGDIVACNYTVTKERRREIDFTIPFMRTSQVLIQRKPEGWRKMRKKEWQDELISEPDELTGKTVHVWKNSSYYDRLVHLQEELGDTIYLKGIDGNVIPEEVMEMVSRGFIDYTVTDRNVALINKRFYPDIDASLELSVKQKIAFGLRKKSPLLRKKLNSWLENFMNTSTFHYIKHKYFNNSSYAGLSQNKYSSIKGNRISPFDEEIKIAAEKYGWDWRLVASIIFEESKFKLDQESWAGAYGLMQFMPGTGPKYGVYPNSPVKVQIEGGVEKLNSDYDRWTGIPDSIQRLKFTLGTYNAGLGHIMDAQRLARKYGKDPKKWDDNVEIYVAQLSKPEFYQDEVCRHGYLRGSQTFDYVRSIFIRYREYKSAFPA
ncbi:MAG: transporter substrate-binding domain-containing protein [Brumimicrobium sp.]|nr:transporter substrate-binding domain-containing protein [Brumimicrobium sp.]